MCEQSLVFPPIVSDSHFKYARAGIQSRSCSDDSGQIIVLLLLKLDPNILDLILVLVPVDSLTISHFALLLEFWTKS